MGRRYHKDGGAMGVARESMLSDDTLRLCKVYGGGTPLYPAARTGPGNNIVGSVLAGRIISSAERFREPPSGD